VRGKSREGRSCLHGLVPVLPLIDVVKVHGPPFRAWADLVPLEDVFAARTEAKDALGRRGVDLDVTEVVGPASSCALSLPRSVDVERTDVVLYGEHVRQDVVVRAVGGLRLPSSP
jgi:hypothetical protein